MAGLDFLGDVVSAAGSWFGGERDAEISQQAALQNIQLQKEFAKNGISWKVNDALRAGVHPLAALGAQTQSFSPVSISSNFAESMGKAGQSLGRAVNAVMSTPERASAASKAAEALTLEREGLQNELLRTQIASAKATLTQGGGNPPMPINQRYLIDGQGNAVTGPLVKDKPMERTPSDPAQPSAEPGAVTDVGYSRTSGGLFPIPAENVKERIEDNWYQETMHFIRNNLLPMISPAFNDPPKAVALGKDKAWVYDPVYGYKQVPNKWHRKFFRY